MAGLAGQLHHTWILLEREHKPSLTALTEALLADWANDPQAVDLELILAELRASQQDNDGASHRDFADQLGHLVWWEAAKLASTHLGLEANNRSALGTAFELGVLLVSTDADHPHLQESSLSDLHEAWVRQEAGDDGARAAALREQLVVLVVVEGKGAYAPDLYVIARRQPGENMESPPPMGVIPVRLHSALERATEGRMRRDIALSRELQGLVGLVAEHDERWRENFQPFDRKRHVDRYRTELRGALESMMVLLEQTTGQRATKPEELAELREAATILVFRVFFVVAMERRGLLYVKPPRARGGFRGLIAAGEDAKDSPFLYLQDLTAAIRGGTSATRRRTRPNVLVKHASIFRNRPTDDFSEGLAGWLDGLDAATPTLAKNPAKLAEWDALLARLEALGLGQIRRYEFEAQNAEPIGGGNAHVQRVLGEVYEQILAMIPVRAGSGKSSRVQLTIDGKPRAVRDIEPTDAKAAKLLEKVAKSERRALGAHYTPEDLVTEVVLAALEPVFAAAWTRARENTGRYREELLGLCVLDPAMGSAHFLTVAALEIAREIAWAELYGRPRESEWFEVWPEEHVPGEEHHPDPWTLVDAGDREELDRIAARNLQEVVQACCHGVDVKPLAVELGKLALWMLTMVERQARGVEADNEPPLLTFVDKNLRCGDSLRGVDETAVERFFADIYGITGRNQQSLFASDVESLDDVLRCLFRLHAVLSRPIEVVANEARELLATAGGELGRELKPVSEDPQDLRAQLYEVTRELNGILRWTWDLAFLYDWYGRDEDALWEALTEPEGTSAEEWVGLLGGTGKLKKLQRFYRDRVRSMARKLRAFHWPLEFYDVFHREERGFDLIVANPPFLGDRNLRNALGEVGVAYLRSKFGGGTPDLCGFFILNWNWLLNGRGVAGTIAPNTLAQAKNRRVVLVPLVTSPGTFEIYRACASRPWPGDAAVHVLTVHIRRANAGLLADFRRVVETYAEDGDPSGLIVMRTEQPISSYLDDGPETEMAPLDDQQTPIAYAGMFPRGAFDRPHEYLTTVPKKERRAAFAYLNNRDVQQQPEPKSQRLIIDASVLLAERNEDSARQQEQFFKQNFPHTFNELRSTVRSERIALPASARNKHAREYWWEFEELRPGLRAAWNGLERVLVIGAVTKVLAPLLIDRVDKFTGLTIVPTHQLFVIPSESFAVAAVLNSLLFETLVRRACSTLKSDLRFTPSEVFPYFPFPWPTEPASTQLHRAPVLDVPAPVEHRLAPTAKALLELRSEILLHPAQHQLTRAQVGGPTDLYNLFDDPNCEVRAIQELRNAHHALERVVLAEYGWEDLHGPWTFERPWIDGTWRRVPPAATRRVYLERLAELNHARAKGNHSGEEQ